jgi:predicted O-linked N-acetylglucosamine transferase (SPINDLY family)
MALDGEGKREEARAAFEKAAQHDAGSAAAHYHLGLLANFRREPVQAEDHLRRAIAIDPNHAGAHEGLAIVLRGEGCWAECLQSLSRAERLVPADPRRLLATLTLPVVIESVESMHRHRRRLKDGLAALLAADPKIPDPLGLGTLDFYLAYHGLDERATRVDIAKLYSKASPGLDYVAPHCRPGAERRAGDGRIRIAFVSKHLRNHTIGRLNVGLCTQIDRSKFHVTVVRAEAQDDSIANRISQGVDQALVPPQPSSLAATREWLGEQAFDVIFYTDIGMEPWTYLLSFARLAPVQCVTWGHPLTTGIPNVDYFISSEHLDTAEAAEHYTERLVRLPNPAVYYYRPHLPPQPKDRRGFGLPEKANLYGCLQTLFKFHPEFDPILGDILRRDPDGLILILAGVHSHRWNELLLRRFRDSFPDVADRVWLLPAQQHHDYLSLAALCDVALDPLHFGGGNTTYEALAFGVPVVTLPSAFLRGRITGALYQQMGYTECIASDATDYADKAVRLGTDREYRASVRDRINQASPVLFENRAGVGELEAFLQEAVAEARAS